MAGIDTGVGRDTVQVNSMSPPTPRQQQVLEFIQATQEATGAPPTLREIAGHFGFRSPNAVSAHVRLLRRKGWLSSGGEERRARSLRVASPRPGRLARRPVADIPVYGSIPAGLAEGREQEARGCLSVDVETIGFKPTPRTFALEVRGDSMTGRAILDGDLVVLEHGMTPRPGDVVAALIDNESTLKTFVLHRGKPHLRAENPKYPDLIPAQELVIQGVMVALIRKRR